MSDPVLREEKKWFAAYKVKDVLKDEFDSLNSKQEVVIGLASTNNRLATSINKKIDTLAKKIEDMASILSKINKREKKAKPPKPIVNVSNTPKMAPSPLFSSPLPEPVPPSIKTNFEGVEEELDLGNGTVIGKKSDEDILNNGEYSPEVRRDAAKILDAVKNISIFEPPLGEMGQFNEVSSSDSVNEFLHDSNPLPPRVNQPLGKRKWDSSRFRSDVQYIGRIR